MIAVIGLGFVGLTTALGFCEQGQMVLGYDADPGLTRSLRDNHVPFEEPELEAALKRHSGEKFRLTDNMQAAVSNSEVIFICVGTPASNDGSVDLDYLLNAIGQILEAAGKDTNCLLVIKSTVPPGTTRSVIKPYMEKMGAMVGRGVGLATNPEFLREGHAWSDFMNPDRIVIGADDPASIGLLEDLYRPFHSRIHVVSTNAAEFIKYASNSLLATLVSFSNELSMIAHRVGDIDIKRAFSILHQDHRWGDPPVNMATYLHPGCGYGGYCLPKDVKAMRAVAEQNGCASALLSAVIDTNAAIKTHLVDHLEAHVDRDHRIGILGLAFKPGTDDVRDSPAKEFIELLLQRNFKNIIAYDPMAQKRFAAQYAFEIDYAPSIEALTAQATHVVILTAWPEFKAFLQGRKDLNIYDFRYFV